MRLRLRRGCRSCASATASRGDVAKRTGIAGRDVAAFERGERVPTPAELEELARVLGAYAGELVEHEDPDPSEIRIDDILEEAGPVDEALADLSSSAPRKERRRLPRARTKLERAFVDAATQLDEVIDCCARIAAAAPTDDLGAIVAELEAALARMRDNRKLLQALERHSEALQRASEAEKQARGASWRSRRPR
jgi:transcriptional regulator with XRE-family HTH domain